MLRSPILRTTSLLLWDHLLTKYICSECIKNKNNIWIIVVFSFTRERLNNKLKQCRLSIHFNNVITSCHPWFEQRRLWNRPHKPLLNIFARKKVAIYLLICFPHHIHSMNSVWGIYGKLILQSTRGNAFEVVSSLTFLLISHIGTVLTIFEWSQDMPGSPVNIASFFSKWILRWLHLGKFVRKCYISWKW